MDTLSGVLTANAVLDHEGTNAYRFVLDSDPFDQLLYSVSDFMVASGMISYYVHLAVSCVFSLLQLRITLDILKGY